jgi:hypothetical protein
MHGADPKLVDALSRARSLELFQLSTVIESKLADPRRIIAIRANMHLGQTVRFLDCRDGQMRSGKVVALKDTRATLHEDDTRRNRTHQPAHRHHRHGRRHKLARRLRAAASSPRHLIGGTRQVGVGHTLTEQAAVARG